MKKSVWSAYFIDLSPEDMVLAFEKAHYHYCELAYEHGENLLNRQDDVTETGKAFKEYAQAHGISFIQGHLPLTYKICQKKEDRDNVKKWIDLYNAIGISYFVLHCDELKEFPELTMKERCNRNIEALAEIGEYIKGTNIVICLENLRFFPTMAEELVYMLEKLDDKHFAICLDTGHLNIAKGNQAEFICKAGNRIKALHIADNEGETDQHMMPCGRGNIDFAMVFSELKKIGYDGIYNLEIPGENRTSYEIRMLKLEYIDKMMDELDKMSEISADIC